MAAVAGGQLEEEVFNPPDPLVQEEHPVYHPLWERLLSSHNQDGKRSGTIGLHETLLFALGPR